jgi:hypothetical protein
MRVLPGGKRIDARADQLQKFEVRRASRDIIHYGGATVYALVSGPGKEGEGI